MRALTWLFYILVFVALFGLALNNRHDVVLHGFFGAQWKAPLILMCLIVFAAGCGLGALAVLWRQWRKSPSRLNGNMDEEFASLATKPINGPTPPTRYAPSATVPSQFGAEASVGTHTVHTPSRNRKDD